MTSYDYLGTVGAQIEGTYEPKHRGEPESHLPAVIIETTDPDAKVLRAPPDGRGVVFVPPGLSIIEWP